MCSEITILVISKAELQHMLDIAATSAVELYIGKSSQSWSTAKVAEYVGVSTRTIATWEKQGLFPKRIGRKWDASEIMGWKRDRVKKAPR